MMTIEQRKMAEDNHNLIYSFLNKFNHSEDEFYDVAAIAYCRAVIDYDETQGQFSTLAYTYMQKAVYHENRKKYAGRRVPEETILYYQVEQNDKTNGLSSIEDFLVSNIGTEEEALAHLTFEEYKKKLKDKDKYILSLLMYGYTPPEISRIVGCSEVKVRRVRKKTTDYFIDNEK